MVTSGLGLLVYLTFMTTVLEGFEKGLQEGLQRVVEGLCKMTTKLIRDCEYF